MNTRLSFLVSAVVWGLIIAACKSNDPRKPFYGSWVLTEVTNDFGTLNFDNPKDYIAQLGTELIKDHFSEGQPGEGRVPTAEDTAHFMSEAKWVVSNVMLPRRIKFRFEKPDKVTLTVLERSALDQYVEDTSTTGTFEVDIEKAVLTMKGVHLTDESETVRWQFQFSAPDRLHITDWDTTGIQKPREMLIFFKEL